MERDLTLFPNDKNGDVLWQMQQAGEALEEVREIESQELALQFGQLLLKNNQKLSCTPFQDNITLPWEVTVYPEMALNHENISAYQELLESNCEQFQGKFDGFYCL